MVDITLTEDSDYYPIFSPLVENLYALGGNDYIVAYPFTGPIKVFAGDGDDIVFVSSPGTFFERGTPINVLIDGGNGNDWIQGGFFKVVNGVFISSTSIDGGPGQDTLTSYGVNDTIRGGDGNDWIQFEHGIAWGDGGNDTIIGNVGDFVPATTTIINARGNAGDDVIYGGEFSDTLSGDEGVDLLVGNFGEDWLYTGADGGAAYGGSNNDILVGAADSDTLVGGTESDIAYGYAGRDWLYGGTANDTLIAGDGNDVIYGGTGINFMYGDGGDDVFIAEGSADQMEGGTGHNYYYRYGAGTSYSLGGAGIDEFIGDAFASNDTVLGLAGNDYLFGGGGNDLLQGGADNDVILGQAGNDTLDGGAGVNLLWANDAGNDQVLVNVADGGTQVLEFFEAGGTNDVVRLLGSNLTSFAGIQNLVSNISTVQNGNFLTNAGSGAQLILGVGTATQTAIWFQGVSAYSLTSGDFLFG
jgi:Ca2+-binding RTX toxin-like protein